MNKTSIEWVKNPDGSQGFTWNPITGCLNGCEYCYARKLANGRLKSRYLANKNYIGQDTGISLDDVNNLAGIVDPCDDPFYPRFWEDRLFQPMNDRHISEKGIFVCDMSDLFGIGIPEWWTEKVFVTINTHPEHRFYLLTKQPQNLIKFSPFPDNCWVGVTAATQQAYMGAIVGLTVIEAKVKYISFEPLLEHIDIKAPYELHRPEEVNWVIIGAQTKPYKPPKIEWVEEIVQACDKAGIPVFLKDNLRPLLGQYFGYEQRQEMPNA